MGYIEIRSPQQFTNPNGLIQIPVSNTDIPTDALLDFDADTITGTQGATVTSWGSTGSNSLVLDVPAYGTMPMPTLASGTVNGHNAVSFDGTQGLGSSSDEEIIPNEAPATIVLVARENGSPGTTARFISGTNRAPNYRNVRAVAGHFTAGSSTEAGGNIDTQLPSAMPTGEWGVYVVRWADGRVKIDSSTGETADTAAIPGPINNFLLGANRGGSDNLRGDIARIQAFSRGITDLETSALITLLGNQYGIGGA